MAPPTPSSPPTLPNPVSDESPGRDLSSFLSSPTTDGETDGAQSPQALHVPSVTGPVGESGLPPSRPTSMAATQASNRDTWSAPPRRLTPVSHNPPGSSGNATATAARPPTSGSRTHVPSVQAHGFFRPMSSQRLQAQRGQRPPSYAGPSDDQSDATGQTNKRSSRNSEWSIPTVRGPTYGQREQDAAMPPSRGTDRTDGDAADRTTANTTPTNHDTVRSRGESVTPLNHPNSAEAEKRPSALNLNKQYMGAPALQTPQRSPHSFRSSFIMPSRGGNRDSPMRPQPGHERLSSADSSPKLRATNTHDDIDDPTVVVGKNWEYFLGNTIFCFGGRLQNTRDKPLSIITLIVIVGPTALFYANSGIFFWQQVSPAIPIVFGYIFLVCMASFFHASFTDPGVLPRNIHPLPPPDPQADPLALGPETTDWVMVRSSSKAATAMEVPIKYCLSCNIWRPPRAHHCRMCDSCIETQDHHCLWLNTCIGRRNYRYFFVFISSTALLGLFLFGASLAHLLLWEKNAYRPADERRDGHGFIDSIRDCRIPFAMMIYAIIATPYPIALWGYHLFLTGRGETTREYLFSQKFAKKDRHRPFNLGSTLKNWAVVFARPRPPTYLQFKNPHYEGDQRFSDFRGRKARTEAANREKDTSGTELRDVRPNGRFGFQGPRGLLDRTPRADIDR